MISILIPTIRPQNIPLLREAIKGAISFEHETLVLEDTDRVGAPQMVKRLVDIAKNEWVVFLGDDTLPEKNCIDNAFQHALNNNFLLVGFNDHHGEKATHWIAHKSLLDYLDNGEFFFTGYIHNFCDDELRVRAEKFGVYGWCKEAGITHNHPAFGGVMDDSYKKQTDSLNWKHDFDLFRKRNCMLSVALIVRNEKDMLAECLKSVKGADEIVVCDTGSTDNTVEIAHSFGATVYTDYVWNDDFAEARNYAVSKCTGDWILSIDADEVLEEGGVEKIKRLLSTSKHAIGIQMTSGNMKYHVPRLFRNIPSVEWRGRIHEIINVSDYEKSDVKVTFRSSPAHLLDPRRNIRILEKAHKEDPSSTRIMFYLGREYGYYKEWSKAENMLEKYLVAATWFPEKADAHFMLALCYWYDGKGNGEKTREHCLKAMNINANFRAPILLMATASYEHNAKQWRKMAETADNSNTLFARDSFNTI